MNFAHLWVCIWGSLTFNLWISVVGCLLSATYRVFELWNALSIWNLEAMRKHCARLNEEVTCKSKNCSTSVSNRGIHIAARL